MDWPEGKPRLRGVSHLIAVLPALIAVQLLAQRAQTDALRSGVVLYGATLVLLFAVSAFYHVPNWPHTTRMWLRRLDRSMIFLFVAGAFTPYFLVIDTPETSWVLPAVWTGAGLGTLNAICFPKSPRPLTAGLYVLLGGVAVPFFPAIGSELGSTTAALVGGGGVAYVIGAICYARKKPNPVPGLFGYHEIFHALVIVGVSLHFAGVWRIVG
jgi:hemolysin III